MISLSIMLPCITYTTLAIDLGLHGSLFATFRLYYYQSIIETSIIEMLQIKFCQLPAEYTYNRNVANKILPTTVKSKIYRLLHEGVGGGWPFKLMS